jgi:hypothetical protein
MTPSGLPTGVSSGNGGVNLFETLFEPWTSMINTTFSRGHVINKKGKRNANE